MIKTIAYYLFLFLITSPLFSLENGKGDSLVMDGVRAFYNYEFKRSIETLDSARDLFPRHSGVHFIWSSAKYYVSQGSDPIHATYDTLNNVLNQIEPIYLDLIANNPKNDYYKLYLGSTRGLRARASLGDKDWLSVLVEAYSGFKIIEEIAENNPKMIDAQLPIGIVEYYASVSNFLIRGVANLYGLNTSKELALKKISNAAEYSEWAWIEASGIISFIYLWIENNPSKSLYYANKLAKEFPRNFYFGILYLESLIKNNMLSEANAQIYNLENRFEELSLRQKEWYGSYLSYEKALLLFIQGFNDESLTLANKAIINYSGELDMILANLYLLKGNIMDLQGNRENAKAFYNKCIKLGNFSYAIKEAKIYITTPFQYDKNQK